MLEIYQKTLSENVTFKGIGLHSGKSSTITVMPGKENEGIKFKRVDLNKNNIISANFKNVSSARLCTTLQNDYGVKVSTVEHLLAAFYIAGIDNAIVEIDNEEVPIMDGSSKDFLKVFEKINIINQKKYRQYLVVSKKVELIDGNRKISIEPNNSSLEVDFQLDYKNKIIGKQKNVIDFQNDNLSEVISSRTFCLFEDIEKIKKFGLAKGGSLENALVVDNEKVLNKEGLRNDKEFVNHKILDLAGDFLLSGYRVIGKVNCYHGGHELTNLFLRKLLKEKSSFKIIERKNILVAENLSTKQPIKLAATA
tara:strand:- start:704 stop:1630 length:927 start_codon:yes stop_codon:yes gene_type:complete